MALKKKYLEYVDLKRPTIIAHRGSSAYAPENTLAAFSLALRQGADGIELDVKLSADGHVVVMHDDTVDRTTNGSGRVRAMTLPELKKLDAGSKFPPKFMVQEIPTLDEVFDLLGGELFINVELTNYSSPTDDLPEKSISIMKKHGLKSGVMFSSFNFMALIRARSLDPRIPLGYLVHQGEAEAAFRSKLVRFSPTMAVHPPFIDVNTDLIHRARQSNCRIFTFTVDQPEIMKQLFTLGVDGIFTNDPVTALKERDAFVAKQP